MVAKGVSVRRVTSTKKMNEKKKNHQSNISPTQEGNLIDRNKKT